MDRRKADTPAEAGSVATWVMLDLPYFPVGWLRPCAVSTVGDCLFARPVIVLEDKLNIPSRGGGIDLTDTRVGINDAFLAEVFDVLVIFTDYGFQLVGSFHGFVG